MNRREFIRKTALTAPAVLMTPEQDPLLELPTIMPGQRVDRVITDEKVTTITLDDGPTGTSLAMAQLLAENNIQAAFAMCGEAVEKNPVIARSIITLGHSVINHSFLELPSTDQQAADGFAKTQRIIEEVTGVSPKYARAPYAAHSPEVERSLRELGMPDVLTTTELEDWKRETSTEEIVANALRTTGPGSIILGHSTNKNTLEGLQLLIDKLHDRGYEFASLDDLLLLGPTSIEQHSMLDKAKKRLTSASILGAGAVAVGAGLYWLHDRRNTNTQSDN